MASLLFNFYRAYLVFGTLGHRVNRQVGQHIGRGFGKVKGDKDNAGLAVTCCFTPFIVSVIFCILSFPFDRYGF